MVSDVSLHVIVFSYHGEQCTYQDSGHVCSGLYCSHMFDTNVPYTCNLAIQIQSNLSQLSGHLAQPGS